jgi:sugar (pentulose or hexulose) kinase
MLFVGIDVGTAGARVAVLGTDGEPAREARHSFEAEVPGLSPGWAEQRTEVWWPAVCDCFRELGPLRGQIGGVSATSTSGTFLLVDAALQPVRPAIMYNDARAAEQTKRLAPYAARHAERCGFGFPSTFALPKLLWLAEHEPRALSGTRLMHAGDYILSKLLADRPPADHSTALKTGCDPVSGTWPEWFADAGVPLDVLPELAPSGSLAGCVSAAAAKETGLPEGTPVALGASDGVATMVGAGAARPGDWAAMLGTTLVVRGISRGIVRDPDGRVYSHRHPEGLWLPGGASNVGGECLERWFPGANLAETDRRAAELLPTQLLAYPLARVGERLPFASATAQGFLNAEGRSDTERYAACLQGVAMVERWIYDLMRELGAEVGDTVYAGGAGSKSPLWTQLRADVTGRTYRVCVLPTGAAGAAILAAAHALGGLRKATERLTQPAAEYRPNPQRRDVYTGLYGRFREECARRGLG